MSNFDSVSYAMNHIDELREQIPASIKAKYPNGFIAIPDSSDLKTIDGSRLMVVVDPQTPASLTELYFARIGASGGARTLQNWIKTTRGRLYIWLHCILKPSDLKALYI